MVLMTHICHYEVYPHTPILPLSTYSVFYPCPGSTRLVMSQRLICLPYPSAVLSNAHLYSAKSNPSFFFHLAMFQAILIDLADVFAGRSSPKSLGLELELLMKTFLCYCVLSLDLYVINTLKVPTSLLT